MHPSLQYPLWNRDKLPNSPDMSYLLSSLCLLSSFLQICYQSAAECGLQCLDRQFRQLVICWNFQMPRWSTMQRVAQVAWVERPTLASDSWGKIWKNDEKWSKASESLATWTHLFQPAAPLVQSRTDFRHILQLPHQAPWQHAVHSGILWISRETPSNHQPLQEEHPICILFPIWLSTTQLFCWATAPPWGPSKSLPAGHHRRETVAWSSPIRVQWPVQTENNLLLDVSWHYQIVSNVKSSCE